MNKDFITEKGLNVLDLVNKYDLNNYYDKMSGQIIINIKEVTLELLYIINEYVEELKNLIQTKVYDGVWDDFYIVGEVIE